ncbi:SO_0444 family Cu/Zn efflux transporter [Pseudoalteromonas sp. BZB3]|uniref:SO_0444 family Cu/Zn efflux transporter n=1 Tax=Pseudoalteromonas sp. BZB3 TaxID=3136670 RepID=UPI0032C472F8
MTLLSNFWSLFLVSAPWLMLGLLLAGLLNIFIPKNFLQKHLGKEGVWTTIKAALIGAPMPLCSCGVIPAAVGLRRAGGSKSATTAFLVSTPETGVDSVSVSYVLLGPFMAIIRPIAAVSSAIVAGLLVGKEEASETKNLDKGNQATASENSVSMSTSCCAPKLGDVEDDTDKQTSCSSKKAEIVTKPKASCCLMSSDEVIQKKEEKPATTNCCGSKKLEEQSSCSSEKAETVADTKTACCATSSEPVIVNNSEALLEKTTSCCDTEPPAKPTNNGSSCCDSKKEDHQATSFFFKLKQAVYFSCNKLLSDTMGWLMIGLFFAALVQTYVPTSFLSQWGDGILAMVVVILVSIPMYICATASTPIAAGLLMAGVSPGAVLVFMLAGPATNIATLGVVATELGKRAVSAYLTGVIGVAIAFGFLTDYLVEQFGFEVNPAHGMEHELMPSWLTQGLGIILLILMLRLVLISLKQRMK